VKRLSKTLLQYHYIGLSANCKQILQLFSILDLKKTTELPAITKISQAAKAPKKGF